MAEKKVLPSEPAGPTGIADGSAGMSTDRPTTDTQHPFSADRPILTRTEDRLGRAEFAEALATSIASWRGRESIVIGVYGPWGSGKTSIKNLAIEMLQAPVEHPEILEFNPWQYRDDELLRRAFFDDLGKAVKRRDASETTKVLVRRLKSYSEVLAVGESVSGGLPKAIPIVLGSLGVIGLGSSGLAAALALPWVATGSATLVALAAGITLSRRFADWLSETLSKLSRHNELTAPELKKEIAGILARRTQPVVVVMDDVDRLRAEEIRHLFPLIKVNADFPNVSYLVLFQRDVVERALAEGAAQPGRRYLEKIVQVGFDVPATRPEDLQTLLFEGLDRILESRLAGRTFDSTRWANVFVPGLSHYFDSLRSVRRYLSTLDFQFSLLSRTGTLEVDPIDLIAIEGLRQFEPEVFHALKDAKDLLTSTGRMYAGQTETVQKPAIMAIVNLAEETHRPWVSEILRRTFPTIEWALGGSRYSDGFSERWQRDLRVCTPDFFERYFRFGLAAGDLSHADLQPLLSGTASREELRDHLLALHGRGLLPLLFDRLEAHKQERPRDNAGAFVTAIFDVGDLLPEKGGGFATIDPLMHAGRVVLWFLLAEEDLDRRQRLIEEAVERTTGLVLPVQYVALEHPSKDDKREANRRTIQPDALPRFRKLCVSKLSAAAEAGQLLPNTHFGVLLFQWSDWGDAAEVRQWVDSVTRTQEDLALFLRGFVQVSTSQGMGDHAVRRRSYVSLQALEEFVDLGDFEKRAAAVDASGLRKAEAEAVALFMRAMNRRRSGKPDEPYFAGFAEAD
jgi:predicted KAP-like P-loop ATPase